MPKSVAPIDVLFSERYFEQHAFLRNIPLLPVALQPSEKKPEHGLWAFWEMKCNTMKKSNKRGGVKMRKIQMTRTSIADGKVIYVYKNINYTYLI